MERRLAAILAADVVGYSRLMGEDEVATLTALKSHREQLFDPKIAEHNGRIVKLMGDGTLVEFASVVDAVECAIAIQSALAEAEDSIGVRIGINLGDVMIDGDDIYGDGVNVAARLEALAQPGGICISSVVRDQIQAKVNADFVSVGKKKLKNIPQPIECWHWSPSHQQQGTFLSDAPALPDKPSVAVLPFSNMSGEQEQEYFVDGITEDIITGLSRCRWLFVIARNSTFTYKGAAVDVRAVGQELGVRYVLEGSVRRASNRVRITAQLIDAVDGKHIWAERYDRMLEDIFELQDEITATIIGNIEPELSFAELNRSQGKSIESLDAWDNYLRARWHIHHGKSKGILLECIQLCHKAIATSPDMACAYSELAVAHISEVAFGYTDDRDESIQLAFDAAQKAVQLDHKDPNAHSVLGRVYDFRSQFEDAVQQHKIALGLNPNSSIIHLFLASTYNHSGSPTLVLPAVEQAYRLSPRDPRQWFMHMNKGFALSQLERHEEAIQELKAACHCGADNYWPRLGLAIVLAHGGQLDEASASLSFALQLQGVFSRTRDIAKAFSSASAAYRDFLMVGCAKAGMKN